MNYSVSAQTASEDNQASLSSALFCRLEGPTPSDRLNARLRMLADLKLLAANSIPAMEEATQMACQWLNMPICVLSIVDEQQEIFKAATGLAQFGLMNPLSQARQLDLVNSFAPYILDSDQPLLVHDIAEYPALTTTLLAQLGVSAYAGVPLRASSGDCIGIFAVMDFSPRSFSAQDKVFLELIARWSTSEYEREQLQQQVNSPAALPPVPTATFLQNSLDSLRLHLIGNLTQELRSPLASIVGMATMLSREIYGPLTDKQREYTDIVRSSSEDLVDLVDEIIELESLGEAHRQLTTTSVDIEMLAQQVFSSLEPVTQRRQQTLQLTIEPGPRIFLLDKAKIKQLLYHLVLGIAQMAGENSTLRLHISKRQDQLNLSVWLSNPWLGEGLPQSILQLYHHLGSLYSTPFSRQDLVTRTAPAAADAHSSERIGAMSPYSKEALGLLLSRYLSELHQGELSIQGNPEAGHRFVVQVPVPALSVANGLPARGPKRPSPKVTITH